MRKNKNKKKKIVSRMKEVELDELMLINGRAPPHAVV